MKKSIVFAVVFFGLAALSGCRLGSNTDDGDVVTNPIISNPAEYETTLKLDGRSSILDDDTATIIIELTRTEKSSGIIEPIKNAEITLSVDQTGGKLDSVKVKTSDNGQAAVKFTANLGVRESATFKITAKYSTLTENISVFVSSKAEDIRGLISFVSDNSYVLNADGTSSMGLTATLVDSNGILISGQKINFKTTAGNIVPGNAQTAAGLAKTEIFSVRRNATAVVTAWLDSDTSVKASVEISFSGMSLVLGRDKESVTPGTAAADGVDTVTVTAVLKDAASRDVYNEGIRFTSLSETLKIVSKDSLTNNRGEAKCRLVGGNAGNKKTDTLMATAAGDTSLIEINYSSRIVKISPVESASNSYVVSPREGDKNLTRMKITYLESSKAPIPNANLSISVSAGGIVNGNKVVPNITAVTNGSGEYDFTIQNPEFSCDLQIKVISQTVKNGEIDEITDKDTVITIKSGKLYSLKLEVTPEVVTVGGEVAQVSATGYDISGNLVANEQITFSMVGGSGGAGSLEPFFATTDKYGQAKVNFVSGVVESDQQGVRLVACSRNGCDIKSDTVVVTVVNAIQNVTLSTDVRNLITELGTYRLQFAVVASDVNNNPVPDGTPVIFSSRIVGIANWQKVPDVSADKKVYSVGYGYKIRPVHDYNFNYIRDVGEPAAYPPYPLPRGEQIANGALDNGFYPDSPFWDINGNGIRDMAALKDTIISDTVRTTTYHEKYEAVRDSTPRLEDDKIVFDYYYRIDTVNVPVINEKVFEYEKIYVADTRSKEWVEPWWTRNDVSAAAPDYKGLEHYTWNKPYPLVKYDSKTEEISAKILPGDLLFYLDYNGNKEFDLFERWQNGSGTYAADKGGMIDIDWNADGVPDPSSTRGVAVPRTVTITGGKGRATNDLTYAQTDAAYLCIEVWAEVKGVQSNVLRFEPLPIVESDKEYVLQYLFGRKQNLDGGL